MKQIIFEKNTESLNLFFTNFNLSLTNPNVFYKINPPLHIAIYDKRPYPPLIYESKTTVVVTSLKDIIALQLVRRLIEYGKKNFHLYSKSKDVFLNQKGLNGHACLSYKKDYIIFNNEKITEIKLYLTWGVFNINEKNYISTQIGTIVSGEPKAYNILKL